MKENNFDKIPIPKYSKEQNDWNTITHLMGTVYGVVILIALIAFLIIKKSHDASSYISIIVYGIAMIGQFAISSSYHHDDTYGKKKQIKRLLDHLSIFILIAGTYMPICAIGLKNTTEGLAIMIAILSMAIIGIALNVIRMENLVVRIITLFFYIAMGWLIICVPSAFKQLPFITFMLLFSGGIVYTIGALLYAIGHIKTQWFHVVFHIFILIGAVLQSLGILFLVM